MKRECNGTEVAGRWDRRRALQFGFLSQGNTQREAQAAREAQQQLARAQAEARRLEGDLDTARRERDALQLEMSLVQVRRRRVPQLAFLPRTGRSQHSDLLGVTANTAVF